MCWATTMLRNQWERIMSRSPRRKAPEGGGAVARHRHTRATEPGCERGWSGMCWAFTVTQVLGSTTFDLIPHSATRLRPPSTTATNLPHR